jgi:hypothetical protein
LTARLGSPQAQCQKTLVTQLSDSLGQMLELQAIFELSAADHVFRQKVQGAVSLSISFFGTYNLPFHTVFS